MRKEESAALWSVDSAADFPLTCEIGALLPHWWPASHFLRFARRPKEIEKFLILKRQRLKSKCNCYHFCARVISQLTIVSEDTLFLAVDNFLLPSPTGPIMGDMGLWLRSAFFNGIALWAERTVTYTEEDRLNSIRQWCNTRHVSDVSMEHCLLLNSPSVFYVNQSLRLTLV